MDKLVNMGDNSTNYFSTKLELKMGETIEIENKLKHLQDEVQQFISNFDSLEIFSINRDKEITKLVCKLEGFLNKSRK